jgi:nucleoside-diphosphate-sugar epimerase
VLELENETIVISGGSGFFGKSILDYLNHKNFKYRPKIIINSRSQLSFSTSEWKNLNITHISSDVKNLDIKNLPKNYYFIHAATSTNPLESTKFEYLYETLVDGTLNLINNFKSNPPKKVIYLSSGAVYGKQQEERLISEKLSFCPPIHDSDQYYGNFKRFSEMIFSNFYKETQIPVIVARLFAFVGPRMNHMGPFAVTNFIWEGLTNKKISVKSDGSSMRSYMSSSDLSEWILQLLVKNNHFDIVNVGSEEKISILSLAKLISEKVNCPLVIERKDLNSNFYVPETSKALINYGLKQNYSYLDDIDLMIEAYKKLI